MRVPVKWIQTRYALGAVVRTIYHATSSLAGRREAVSIARLRERWGSPPSRSYDKPVWIVLNGGEVTQTITFVKLLHEALSPTQLVLTTSNTYAADFAARHLPWLDGTFETPWDLEPICRRALKRLAPRALVFIENVYVPVLARTARDLGIPTILASGLVQSRFRFHPLYVRPYLLRFSDSIDLHIAKGERDAQTLTEELGVPPDRVRIGGNLKFDVEFMSQRERLTTLTLESLGSDWTSAFVILAGSIHKPEGTLIAKAVSVLRDRGHRVRLIVAPRYPAAAAHVAEELRGAGISSRRRSLLTTGEPVEEDALLIDTFGELPALYALADTVLLGGTFFRRWKVGFGQNIAEPLMAFKPILHGPFLSQFEDIRERLREAWAGVEVESEKQLIHSLEELIARPDLRRRLSEQARAIVDANAGNARRHVELIVEMLARADRTTR